MRIALLFFACTLAPQDETPETLKSKIDALKVDKVAWRGIAWKTCLLDAIREAREKKKPVLAWVFIDRPVDDKRC